jgi:Ca-activated chloride channel family protein
MQHLGILFLSLFLFLGVSCQNVQSETSAPMSLERERSDGLLATAPAKAKQEMGATSSSEAEVNTEGYKDYGSNPHIQTQQDRFSTFAIDVDTGSYTIARRKINEGQIPPKASVRVEEFINYFPSEYPKNTQDWFKVHLDSAPSPFREAYHLLRVVVQGQEVLVSQRKMANLVFLVDTSGSMSSEDKMGLVKQSLSLLVDNLQERDRIAICTYAGSVQTVLRPTSVSERKVILASLESLSSGGSTAMASGIQNAYDLAYEHYQAGAINRVIVCSDGDANVGPMSHKEILELIGKQREKGITLSTVGFGMGNYKDEMMEQLADKGNGNYTYVDNLAEAKRIFVEELTGTLQVIAKDMKVQVEFYPESVETYRLIGYENRDVADKDFRDDQIDGGEVGSGHTVTALYELKLKANPQEICRVFVRAKEPEGSVAQELQFAFKASQIYPQWSNAPATFRFIAGVAEFAEILKESPHSQTSFSHLLKELKNAKVSGQERQQEFVSLVEKTNALKG